MNAFTAKEYTCYYARVLDRDLELAVDHLADMLQHSLIRIPRPGRRAPGDPRGDQHARGLAGRPGPRPVHRGAVARPSARTAGAGNGGDDRGGHARVGQPVLQAALRPGNFVVAAAGNVRARRPASLLADRMETGRPLATGAAPPGTFGRPARPPGLRGATRPAPQDGAGAHLSRHRRTCAHRPRPVRLHGRQHGARRRDVIAPLPRDPRAAGPGVLGLQLSIAVHRGRDLHRLRGDHAGSRGRGDRPAASRASGRRVGWTHRGRVRTGEGSRRRVRWCSHSKIRGDGCLAWASPRSRTARS